VTSASARFQVDDIRHHLHFAVISDMSAIVITAERQGFWTPGTTVSPKSNRQIGDDAIQGDTTSCAAGMSAAR
jgi:hypothetical protein